MDTPEDVSRAVSLAVAAALKTRGIPVAAAAAATSIPRTTLMRRLTGVSPLLVTELAALCALLDISMPDLVASVGDVTTETERAS